MYSSARIKSLASVIQSKNNAINFLNNWDLIYDISKYGEENYYKREQKLY